MTQLAYWRFDETGAVAQYSAYLPNLSAWVRDSTGIDFSTLPAAAVATNFLCPTIQSQCQGANQQFDTVDTCIATLSQKPTGRYDEAWGDNLVCRTIHLVLTGARPAVHCMHVGPDGGGKCVDGAYAERFFADEELFGAPLGGVFSCGGS